MFLQAAGLVRLVSWNIPTGEMQFEVVDKHVEHENWIVILIFHLLGGFAIDGSDERRVLKQGIDEFGKGILQVGKRKFLRTRVNVLSQGDFNSPLIFPKRKNLESFPKCRFVHRAISAGVETFARSPSRTTARRVEQGCEVPCLERGSGTFGKHWAKRASASGTQGNVDIFTSG